MCSRQQVNYVSSGRRSCCWLTRKMGLRSVRDQLPFPSTWRAGFMLFPSHNDRPTGATFLNMIFDVAFTWLEASLW